MILTALVLALCPPVGERVTCIHDADSIVLDRERIRIANIDGAELNARCERERILALRGRDRLLELLSDGFTVERRGMDRWKRTLAVLRDRQGRDVGRRLVSEGLARPWRGKREPWC